MASAEKSTIGERHAFMFVDPGGTTGVAAVHVDMMPTVKRTLQEGLVSRKAVEVPGQWDDQAEHLAELMVRFAFGCEEAGIGADRRHLGFENYTRRPQASDSNLTSVWVMAATVVLLPPALRRDVVYQEPSDAKAFATNERLRLWGLWEVGSEHKRDAMRHVALRINRVLC